MECNRCSRCGKSVVECIKFTGTGGYNTLEDYATYRFYLCNKCVRKFFASLKHNPYCGNKTTPTISDIVWIEASINEKYEMVENLSSEDAEKVLSDKIFARGYADYLETIPYGDMNQQKEDLYKKICDQLAEYVE